MSEVNADPDGQPGGHYHQSLVSSWGVAVAAHGKASDNHIIVLGAPFCPPSAFPLPRTCSRGPGDASRTAGPVLTMLVHCTDC